MAIYGGRPDPRWSDDPYGGQPHDGAPGELYEDHYGRQYADPQFGYAPEAYPQQHPAGPRRGAPPPPQSRFGGRKAAILLGVIALLIVGAGTAGAATFLNREPNKVSQDKAAPSSAPSASVPAAPAVAESISMSATGDIVLGNAPGGLPPENGKGFFDPVRSALQADFQMGNLEQTITDDTGVSKCSAASAGKTCFAFRTPPSTAQNLKDAGFHLVTLANNHAYDYGEVGYKNTQKALDAVGIKYTGWPNQITVHEVKGVKVAVVGFASYAWSNLCSDLTAATRVVKDAATKADLVVVQVHMGAEGSDKTRTRNATETFLGENRCNPVAFGHAVVDAGADLLVGHGPHVMRGMEFYKGRLLAYSLGNFAGYKALGYNGIVGVGGVLKVSLKPDGTYVNGSLAPTYMVAPGLPRPDPKKQAITLVGGLSKTDFPTTGAKIDANGVITAPA